MTTAIALGIVAVVLFGPAGSLIDTGSWSTRAPRSAIVLWQATGLAGALALMGAGLAVTTASYHLGLVNALVRMSDNVWGGRPLAGLGLSGALGLELAADIGIVLVVGLASTSRRLIVARSRHRQLLDLVGMSTDRVPGALILNDPRATAYCLPGLRPRVVISVGAMEVLNDEELSAVMDHERAHANGRHDIALLPFVSLASLLGWVPYVRRARGSVEALLEMAADDFASRRCSRHALASALVTMAGSGGIPTGMLAASTVGVPVRVHRLIGTRPNSTPIAVAALVASIAVTCLPFAVLALVGGL